MSTRTLLIAAVVAACVIAGCGSITIDYEPSPLGDDIDACVRNGDILTGEFLSIDDTAIYIISRGQSAMLQPPLAEGELVCVPLKSLDWISVNGYADRSWLLPIAVFQVLPAILIGIAAEDYNGTGAGHLAAWLIPGVATALLFEFTTPRAPGGEWPFPENEKETLRKYARYPRGLPPGAVEAILDRQNQRELRSLP